MTKSDSDANHAESASPRPTPEEAEQELVELVSRAWDIVRYAPIGILLDGPALLPKLAEQGKVHVRNAEWLGGMFLRRGRAALRKGVEEFGGQAVDFLKMMGAIAEEETAAATAGRRPANSVSRSGRPATAPTDNGPDTPTSSVSADDLAIPDYDSLSASQVVNRLPSLTPEELEAVRDYEAAHRGRKTILNKVLQLQA